MLEDVIDPETNYSIVKMGFIRNIEIEEGKIKVTLSPPTFWCPPLFLYMILEDVKRKLSESYNGVLIQVVDHHDAEKLTSCINNGKSFEECYKNEVEGNSYEAIRERFRVKRERDDRLSKLTLSINGEFCRLIYEAKRK
ncbi:metal-sulfur cluster assembly factor [Saccharolobus solfataricus]|uniref:MIP18 family-like domain-containing protein n=3 Tax=Saccharolobus solfataricus TaxID=2287 RepID=Q97XR5_SACS2|nr:metal-sulfur cluster assembly factor [Saccharolobus solfataricus]AAK41858.1 Conserved hypothetical protein [Saccharolobus solfataricus P2]AKA74590.1 metal-sulfur cluster assembly factor [Saccharolobus solfataricus]AKA77286.1 metal-sulfur cluster assembly factor [Saccharolobus solfataricus]AKA79978.1 metal-sulfur cluster assembly factor [Saccharolobus solfataricus]AZF69060.1 metal-sulfur cluster assembly factor [Saccharolobus solfataricus]